MPAYSLGSNGQHAPRFNAHPTSGNSTMFPAVPVTWANIGIEHDPVRSAEPPKFAVLILVFI